MKVVLVTVPTERDGKIIARKLVDEDLAKCVSMMPIESFFKWEGQHNERSEQLLIIKLADKHYEDLEKKIKEMHPDELPMILALPVEKAYKPYLDWVES